MSEGTLSDVTAHNVKGKGNVHSVLEKKDLDRSCIIT